MKKFYQMGTLYDEYAWVQTVDEGAGLLLQRAILVGEFKGIGKIKMEWVLEDLNNDKVHKFGDIHTYAPDLLLLSKKAATIFQNRLDLKMTSIDIVGLDGKYALFDVTDIITGAFDWKLSDYIGNRKHLSMIKKAVLRYDKIEGRNLFKLKEDRVSMFVSEEFKRIIEKHKLTGFDFKGVGLA